MKLEKSQSYPHVIVITGPTASGKSSLAIEVARHLGCHIISADSRQIYRGIPITTAVPTPEERTLVPHHLVETLELDRYYSAANFEADALGLIEEAAGRGDKFIVVCGGSMMYIDALLYGLDELPTISDEVRHRVKSMYESVGLEGLVAYLGNLDAHSLSRVDLDNPRRVMHAVELCLQTGVPASSLFSPETTAKRDFVYSKFVIDLPREELFARINRRVDQMVDEGMENEARSVFHLRHLNSLNTIGFKEWFACFDGVMDRDTAIARIAKNTRVYAKKQLTWLARQSDVLYLSPRNAKGTILKSLDGC